MTETLAVRWLRRYKFFFLIGLLIFLIQVYLAYNSFKLPIYNNDSYISDKIKKQNHNSPIKLTLKNNHKNNNELKRNSNDGGNNNLIDDEDIHSNSNLYSKTKNNIKDNTLIDLSKKQKDENQQQQQTQQQQINNNLQKTYLKLDELNFTPNCNIIAREAISAIHRAKSIKCKEYIAKIACDIQNDIFYPKILPNYCPNGKFIPNRSLGCFKDEKNYRILSGYYTNFKATNSPKKCIQMCLQSGFLYAGVQYSTECFCGNDEPSSSVKLADPSCNMKCPGNPKQACGGYFTVNVYETGITKFAAQVAEVTPKSGVEPVRVAYLLTLNGRAVRQVHRLLKAIYHPRNFYYIHIDSRQDYMYRKLLELEDLYPNIRLSRTRFSTIWGGASLLQMLLSSLNDLYKSNWKWDFVINLSETDFPVKSTDKLIEFLTANKNKNFVKSHGREVQRFIQKQGLDKTFVECDTHMWRIGDRELPGGIQIDGGSDWIGLSRNFIEYIINEKKDDLINGLLIIFRHTLLPAESFFHTVIRNSHFCNTYIDNNLHVTNWKRRFGCKCQYKHVVDWCGCSPNDFKPDDWARLESTETKQLYFARKFEPIINQAILLQLEEWIYGPINIETLNLNNYWQSIYHIDDTSPQIDDVLLTIATSLIRINSKSNTFNLFYEPKKIIEITTFMENDHYKGFIIHYEVNIPDYGLIELETLIKPIQIAKSSTATSLGNRLRSLEVSSDYDQKEQIARNFAKILGPNSEPVLVFRLGSSQSENQTNYNITILWIDSTGNLINIDEYHIEDGSSSSINFIKPILKQPLIPGVWTTKLIYKKSIIAQCKFLISPLQFIAKDDLITKSNNNNNKKGNNNKINNLNIQTDNINNEWLNYLLPIDERKNLIENSISNSKRIGLDLQQWIDSLVTNFYLITTTCIVYNNNENILNNLTINNLLNIERCQNTNWSTFAPDPKSDIKELNKS